MDPRTSGSSAGDRFGWLVVLLVPSLLVFVGAWAFYVVSDSDDPVRPTNNRGDVSAQASGAESDAEESVIEDCGALWQADAAAVTAASATLEQWRAHIDAQVRFNEGAITGVQAKEQWAASKVGAAERSQAFEQADAAYRQMVEGGNGA
jgi:hypothetical protein